MRKVSIIIPIYNSEKYLNKCLDSILNQTYENLDIILVNDGSIDNSKTICDEYLKIDRRINVIHKENGGAASARNIGIKSAVGDYIMFVDSDDYISTSMVEIMVSSIEDKNSDLAVCGFNIIKNRTMESITYENGFYDTKEEMARFFSLLNGRTNSVCNKIYRKTIIKYPFDEKLVVGEDLIFNLECFSSCKSVVVIENKLYFYRRANSNSLSQSSHENFFQINIYLYQKLNRYLIDAIDKKYNSYQVDMYYFKNLIIVINDIINYSPKTLNNKIKEIKNIWKNEQSISIIFNTKEIPAKYKVIRFLIKYKMVFLLLIIFRLNAVLTKNRFKKTI